MLPTLYPKARVEGSVGRVAHSDQKLVQVIGNQTSARDITKAI